MIKISDAITAFFSIIIYLNREQTVENKPLYLNVLKKKKNGKQ